jgi:tRNA(Ile)-lysidine synthase
LHEFFSAWDDIYDLVESQSGTFFSAEFRLLKDRDSLILSPIGLDDNNNSEYFIYEGTKDVKT